MRVNLKANGLIDDGRAAVLVEAKGLHYTGVLGRASRQADGRINQ